MHALLQDLRYCFRQLIKSPGFTLTAVVSLALGIGATTAVFSVIYAALLNPYPYPNADRIMRLTATSKQAPTYWVNPNGPQIRQLQQLPMIQSVLAMDSHAMILTGHDLPENVRVIGLISGGFDDLGVPPLKWAEGHVRDPVILVAGTLLLSLVAAIACAIPARHALAIDPMTALRRE